MHPVGAYGRFAAPARSAIIAPMERIGLYPLTFTPIYRDYVWGGDRLATVFGRKLPGPVIAESWEICDRSEEQSLVAEGPLQGTALGALVAEYGSELVGTAAPMATQEGAADAEAAQEGAADAEAAQEDAADRAPGARDRSTQRFPLLCKIIDARERLSLQVHPDEEGARRTGGEPKAEMWVALGPRSGARVLLGLRPGTDRDTLERALAAGAVESLLHDLTLAVSESIEVPGGTVHAIDAGCLLYEVQQNSDTTYRVFDWGRVGPGGRSRLLHVEQGLAVINWSAAAPRKSTPRPLGAGQGWQRWELLRTPQFRVERMLLEGSGELAGDPRSFQALFVERGALRIASGHHTLTLFAGTSCLVPACLPSVRLEADADPRHAPVSILRTRL